MTRNSKDKKIDHSVEQKIESESIQKSSKTESEDVIEEDKISKSLPILPLKNTVLFPGVVLPIVAGRKKAIQLIKHVDEGDQLLGVVAQKVANVNDPKPNDLNTIGTVAKVLRIIELPDNSTTVILEGRSRFKILKMNQSDPFFEAEVEKAPYAKTKDKTKKYKAIIDTVRDVADLVIRESDGIPTEASIAVKNIKSDSFLINFITSNMNFHVNQKQEILEENDYRQRALKCLRLLNEEHDKVMLRNDIQSQVRKDIDVQQREYFLQQQMKTIQKELGKESFEDEIEELRSKAKSKKWDDKVKELFDKEVNKLQRMNPQLAEYSVQRIYLDLFLDLPWGEYSVDKLDLKRAQKILDRDHFGLEKVKKRMIEFLAVFKLKKDLKSPLLCLVGPPGVGKTSLGKSIAEALGRSYVRISLGGLHDESEIRGHRRTYIGSRPGRIIQSIKKAKTSNPVFVLDEIDKIGRGSHGNPEAAFLEVLDPEQNHAFYDNYLETGYDLTKVLFIATANNLNGVHNALKDRMEIIEVSGYTLEEKVMIAKKHLIPKSIKEHGLTTKQIKLSNSLLEKVIDHYTYESGVRGLEKQIASLVRYTAKSVAMEEKYHISPRIADLSIILGPEKKRRDKYENNEVAGVATGLAWTWAGGAILFVESAISKGKGKLAFTGNLGKIMSESATIAMEYIKANAIQLGLEKIDFEKYNVHIHVPEGATPKDGPSAGIAILTSLVSLFTQKRIKSRIAFSGEITIRGKVLPVGGLKEKILAAKRSNIKEIVLSQANKGDVDYIEQKYLKGLKFHYVDEMMEVINIAITNQLAMNAKKL
ncbi:MAG: endopeptidase La [Flavobacteriaceae bacterium]|nr:endopeptidase La [Flavobacteriaceae bacterium]MCY4267876.1 endopeptidase La [Flavobacteriaceae bacterium]